MSQIRFRHVTLASFAIALSLTLSAHADDVRWGNLSVRFVYDGKAPVPRTTLAIPPKGDMPGFAITDESLLVNDKNQGIANVVIYLLPPEKDDLHVHPSYDRSARDKVKLTMSGRAFKPHVLLLRTTQTMVQENQDDFGYNVKIGFIANAPM